MRDYIDAHPSIKECLGQGLVNLSALSRRIMEERGIDKMEAALVACRRYQLAAPRTSEQSIKRTLARSRVEVASRISIVTMRNEWQIYDRLAKTFRQALAEGHRPKLVQGSKAITLIADEATARGIADEIGQERALDVHHGLVELSVTSPDSIRATPGIMAYLCGSLASNGINVLETMSTYTDTIFVVDPADMTRAFETLSRCVES